MTAKKIAATEPTIDDATEAPAEELDNVGQSAETAPETEDSETFVTEPGSDEAQTASELSPEEIDKLKQKLRHKAERMVIDQHRDSYNKIAEALFAEKGLEFTRRATPAERAKAKLTKVLEDNEELQSLSPEELIALLTGK